jgi:hypothetical protein
MTTNWESLAKKLKLSKKEDFKLFNQQDTHKALEEILGEEWIKQVIDLYIKKGKCAELALNTLGRFRSKKAAKYAFKKFEQYKDSNIEKAELCITAMGTILHPICLEYAELISREDQYIENAAVLVADLIEDNVYAFNWQNLENIIEKVSKGNEDLMDPVREYAFNALNPEKYTCPCCGYKTHSREVSAWDLCHVCFWENDLICLDDPNKISGANKISLIQAQQNFITFAACDESAKAHVRPPKSDEVKDIKWKIYNLK